MCPLVAFLWGTPKWIGAPNKSKCGVGEGSERKSLHGSGGGPVFDFQHRIRRLTATEALVLSSRLHLHIRAQTHRHAYIYTRKNEPLVGEKQ